MTALLAVAGLLLPGAPNPVLPKTNDIGVMRHAGEYYLMGMGTAGGVFTSGDLVNWSGPRHVFSMDNAWTAGPSATDGNLHACDLICLNGVFHLYWSVNHGDLRQIGHAVADTPLGPYTEPVREVPFDGRIDPQCFQDEDGRLYFYTVKFTLGNVIWGRPLADPWTLTGADMPLLSVVPGTWETLDTPPQFVNEGPFVVRHRGRYYLLYNANHTSGHFGNYALGVAEADSPLGYSNLGKYPFPVLRSNRDPKHEGVAPPDLPEVKNCGQPNLVRGPNGFEWWLVYFADHPGRSQHIDRAHFFGRELFIEGPTTADTPGYHPPPALPTFRDLFDGGAPDAARWRLEGAWRAADGALRSADGGTAHALAPEAAHCLLETTFRLDGGDAGRLGAIAWEDGQNAGVRIGVDRAAGAAFFAVHRNGAHREETLPLPAGFNWAGPHSLRIARNAGTLTAHLDGILLNFADADIPPDVPGGAGLFAEACAAAFESFSLTRGWEEWGGGMRGWTTRAGRALSADAAGLRLGPDDEVFKGDALTRYEFSIQLPAGVETGVYAAHAEDGDFLLATADAAFTQITVTGKRGGGELPERAFPVRPRIHRAHPAAENGNHLRVVKLDDRVILFAEGCQIGEIQGGWPGARIGLRAGKAECVFTDTACHELP